jgi:hypothetical protein
MKTDIPFKNCATYINKEEVKAIIGLNDRVKSLEVEAIPQTENKEPEKHEEREKNSPKDVSSN